MDYRPFIGPPTATPSSPESTLWDYSFPIGLYGEREATFTITWNESRKDAYTIVVDEVDDVLQARVTSERERSPIVGGDGSGMFTLTFEQLDVREVHCARVEGFEAPVAPMLELREPIPSTDLASALEALLGGSTTWQVELRCHYAYSLGGNDMRVPVVLVAKHDLALDDRSLFEQIDATLQQWRATAQPPENDARYAFDVAVWSSIVDRAEPLLRATIEVPATRP